MSTLFADDVESVKNESSEQESSSSDCDSDLKMGKRRAVRMNPARLLRNRSVSSESSE